MLQRKAVAPATLELLNRICSITELNDFYLAGGTSLALQIGHRLSFDLDFFGNREFQTQEIIDLLANEKSITILSQRKNILILNINNIKVDFVNYHYPHIGNPILSENIRLLSLEDIAAMKLAAIAGRGRKRDFYDLYFLLQRYSLRSLVDFYKKKFEDGSELMVARSLTFFEDADTDEGPVLLGNNVEWSKIKKHISEEVRGEYL